jgi:hypothetical protein
VGEHRFGGQGTSTERKRRPQRTAQQAAQKAASFYSKSHKVLNINYWNYLVYTDRLIRARSSCGAGALAQP